MTELEERWGDDLGQRDDIQQAFIDGILETYGDQIFEVLPENLQFTLVDIQRRMDQFQLQWPVPSAVAEAREIPTDEGDIEMFVYPSMSGNWVIALFPIFSGE